MFRLAFLLPVTVLVVVLCATTMHARTWTDSTGTHKIEGEFVKLTDGKVDIRRDDGKLVRIPLDKLSEDDQKFARKAAKPAGDETPFAVAGDEEKPAAKQETNADAKDLQTVVAEGTGTTEDAALKDAFRQAVQQVVGAVVDAETLVKNDELITDKVLIYSDGFVKTWDKLSEKQQGGLVRIKIRAQVERRSVIAKLKAANITVKKIDGGGLFAEAVTQLDAETSAAGLLQKALKGYPANVVVAEAIGKPRLMSQSETKATIEFDLKVGVDVEKYNLFTKKLLSILEKTAKEKGEVFAISPSDDNGNSNYEASNFITNLRSRTELNISPTKKITAEIIRWHEKKPGEYSGFGYDWWKTPVDPKTEMALILNTSRNKLYDRTTWRWYHVGLLTSFPKELTVDAVFVDRKGEEVVRDSFVFKGVMPGLASSQRSLVDKSWQAHEVIVTPFTLIPEGDSFAPSVTITREMSLSLGELKTVDSIRSTARAKE